MKKTLYFLSTILLLSVFALTSCSNYGKKIKISGTKGEVYYKGEGVTESDAMKVGDYLKETSFFGNEKGASVQLTKIGERFVMRFVYSKDYYEKTKGLEKVFQTIGVKMSETIFNGSKVDIILTDSNFNDFKSIPYDETAGTTPEEPKGPLEGPKDEGEAVLSKDDFDHDKAGGVDFFWKGISDQESKTIADYIVQNGSFAGGTAEIYMTKEGERYILSFPVKLEYQQDASTISEIEKISKDIKDNVFPNSPYTFRMTDSQLKAVKSFDY